MPLTPLKAVDEAINTLTSCAFSVAGMLPMSVAGEPAGVRPLLC